MRAACWLFLLTFATTPILSAQSVPDASSYRVFRSDGEARSLDDVVRAARTVDVVLLGEAHNDRIGHGLQLEILRRLLDPPPATGANELVTPRTVALSLEMFERDVQYIVDEYLAGLITEDQFLKSGRPWPHYGEDYRPLVELARAGGIRVVAANAPRRYVNRVTREGPHSLTGLSETARRALPPLPWAAPSDAYRAELDAIMGAHGDTTAAARAHDRGWGAWAQSLWDATMAYSIVESLIAQPDALVVHAVGSFHVANRTGIPEHVARYRPATRMLIVLVDPVTDIGSLRDSHKGSADYIILTDSAQSRSMQEQLGTGTGRR